MKAYVIRRLVMALLTVIGASMLIFGIIRALPGSPVSAILARAELGLTPQEIENMLPADGVSIGRSRHHSAK